MPDEQQHASAPSRRRAVVEVGRAMLAEWRDDRVSGLGAEIAFWAVLSLVPSVLVLSAALGFIEPLAGADAAEETRTWLVDQVRNALGDDNTAIDAFEELFDRPSPGAFTIGLLGAVWTASRGFGALIRGLDVVYDLDEVRSWLGVRVLALALALGSLVTGAVVLVMLVFGPLFGTAGDISESLGFGSAFESAWRWLRLPVAVAVMVLWSATVFHIAPNHRTPWRWDVPGAVLTTLLWLAGSVGFRAYLVVASGDGNAVLGVLGGFLTLLLYLYVMTLALLVGGELNQVLADRFAVEQLPTSEHRLRRALAHRLHALAPTGLAGRLRGRRRHRGDDPGD